MAEKAMAVHPLCRMFSSLAPLSKAEKDEMREDIKQNGIKVPILVNPKKNVIYDGLTRWTMAHELNIPRSKVPMDTFKGDEEAIEREILSRNLFRRHMSDDQRAAIVSKLLGPKLEQEAKERQAAGGREKDRASGSFKQGNGAGSTAAKVAKTAGVSAYKGEQAEKVRKAGQLDEVISGKVKLGKKARSIGRKARKPKKEVSFEDQTYAKWTRFINSFAPPVRRRVMDLVAGWIGKK